MKPVWKRWGAFTSPVNTRYRRGLTRQTDGMSVTFIPPVQCQACAQEFVSRKGLLGHKLCSHKFREGELPWQPLEPKGTQVEIE